MQQNQKKLDSLRHDMKNHMYLLQTYLNEEGMIRHRNM